MFEKVLMAIVVGGMKGKFCILRWCGKAEVVQIKRQVERTFDLCLPYQSQSQSIRIRSGSDEFQAPNPLNQVLRPLNHPHPTPRPAPLLVPPISLLPSNILPTHDKIALLSHPVRIRQQSRLNIRVRITQVHERNDNFVNQETPLQDSERMFGNFDFKPERQKETVDELDDLQW